MTDKIIQITTAMSLLSHVYPECTNDITYGLSESGKLYRLDFDDEKLKYIWEELLESPKK